MTCHSELFKSFHDYHAKSFYVFFVKTMLTYLEFMIFVLTKFKPGFMNGLNIMKNQHFHIHVPL